MIHELLDEREVQQRLLGYADGERRVTNLRHAIELIHEAEEAQQLAVEGVLHWLRARHEQQVERDRTQLRLESDERAVQ
ncbi:MAG TPA: hypothetical protein VGR27_02930, partial [Longimicrobiaceae bacterium]|nr:hypothetical protein [Longimicrobiaceae bacterium]